MSHVGPVASFEAKLYYDSADSIASATWVEIKNIKDVAEPDAAEKLDVSTRASKNKKYWSGMVDQGVSTQYQYQKGVTDTVFTALKTKKESGDLIQLACADGDIVTPATIYFKDWFIITKFDRKEDLGGTIVYDLEFAPAPKFNSGVLVDRSYITVS
jgi:hypothetical protein